MECADVGAKRARYKELWVSAQSRFSRDRGLEREEISLSSHAALAFSSSMIFSDLPSPAEASNNTTNRCHGFAQAGNRLPPRIKSEGELFGIML